MPFEAQASARSPLVYEINTRCWLRDLSHNRRECVSLANVPESEFRSWRSLGLTHIWLMGVWPTGARSRAQSMAGFVASPASPHAGLPGFQEADFLGSPYAIQEYRVCDRLGGAAGLKQFRERLHAHRLKLILDFVPNHVGLDHAWVRERPDLFVQGSPRAPGTFSEKTVDGRRWLAHGRDPYFPPWADTVQLDYRQPATHVAMRHQLHAVAELCDGVRCDMAMLVTNEVFARTWADFPCRVPQPPVEEFWKETIASVRRISPEFLFLAEVYWNLEAHLQSLGFDFTYHKTVYDHLVARRYPPLQQHLLAASPSFLQASAHFLENHDEPRIASLLQPAEHRAAALLTLALPGMKILHEGQLSGWVKKAGIHFARRLVEPGQAEVSSFYESLLRILPTTALGRGKAVVLRPQEALPGNTTAENTVAVLWREDGPVFEFDLAVVNLAPHPSQCRLQWKMEGTPKQSWKIRNLLGREPILFPESEQQGPTICLDLPAHAAWILHGEPVP